MEETRDWREIVDDGVKNGASISQIAKMCFPFMGIQSGETSPATGAIPEAESYRKEWRSWPQYMCYRKPVDASVRVSVFCWLTPQVLWWCEQPKPHEKLESPIGRG